MLRPAMNLPERSEFSSQALTSDIRSFIFLRFRSGTRIPHHVSPSRSIQEILNFFRYFLIQVHFGKSEFHSLSLGKSISILVPFPGALSTLTFAPCSSAPCLTIESPRPVPPRSLEWLLSTREKRSKILS